MLLLLKASLISSCVARLLSEICDLYISEALTDLSTDFDDMRSNSLQPPLAVVAIDSTEALLNATLELLKSPPSALAAAAPSPYIFPFSEFPSDSSAVISCPISKQEKAASLLEGLL